MSKKTLDSAKVLSAIETVAPNARANYLDACRMDDALFKQHEVTTPIRMAHFLAQALHETGGFRIQRESMSYSAERLVKIFGVGRHSAAVTDAEAKVLARNRDAIAERVYGLGNPKKARELGNKVAGDAFLYRGNGVLQTTGRGNHKRMGDACGVDFEADPALVTVPEHALKPALHEWTASKLNGCADKNDIDTITRRINGGFNGREDRVKWFNRLWPLLKNDDQPGAAWEAAEEDNAVKRLQRALNDLGASPKLVVDGRGGSKTERAVKAFQSAAGLPVDGVAGPITLAAIKLRLATIR